MKSSHYASAVFWERRATFTIRTKWKSYKTAHKKCTNPWTKLAKQSLANVVMQPLKRQHGHRHFSSSSKPAPYHSHQFMVSTLKVDHNFELKLKHETSITSIPFAFDDFLKIACMSWNTLFYSFVQCDAIQSIMHTRCSNPFTNTWRTTSHTASL